MEAIKFLNQELSWDSLDKKLKDLTTSKQTKKAGDIFETVVKYYLLTNSKYKSTLINVWLLEEVPAAVKLKLNLPNSDEGIDLIAETKNKHFWAIQAKYRSDPNETLTIGGKGSLATFNNLAFGYCKNISHGLVFTTVNKPPKKIKLINHVGFETLESFLSLDDNNKEEWKSLLAASVGKIIKPKKLEPRPHQVEAIKKAVEYFKVNERGKMIMPCGTGKSLAAFWIAKEMKAKSILIAVPSLTLLQQTLKIWTREFLINDINPDWLCICSDDTVKDNQDSFVSFTYDLGIEVTTDKNQIKKFLESDTKNIKVIFSTYQSGKVTAEGSKGFVFDLGIMDEAHKTVGHIDKPMALLLNEKNIKIKHRLFMTATERLFRENRDEYVSMNKERDYGKIIYELTFKDAINAKPPIISDYKIITFGISEPEMTEIYKDNKFLQIKEELKDITAREFAIAIALRKAIKDLKITNAISFHSSIERALNFRDQQSLISKIYPEYGSLKTFHVSGKMTTSDRSLQMRLFGEEKGLMTNARCLTEGVDLPAIDCICFTDPKRSKVDIVQAAGRALRLFPGKKFGYILIPIFIPANEDPQTASKDDAFEEIVATVGALSTQDTRIAEYLRIISEGREPTEISPLDEKIIFKNLTSIDPGKFKKAIQLMIWDRIVKVNYKSYNEAKEYAKSLNLKSRVFWKKLAKEKKILKDFPKSPEISYQNEWKGWGEFLGTGRIADHLKTYRKYEKAKEYAKSLNLKSREEWFVHTRSKNFPKDIPAGVSNSKKYKKEWENWGEFLGSGNKKNKYTISYNEAKEYARKLGLNTYTEWSEFSKLKKLREDIPREPQKYFKNEWKGWSEFLGTQYIDKYKIKFVSYEEAKKFVQPLKLSGQRAWFKLAKLKKIPQGIPINVVRIYKNHWISWGEFLGNGRISRHSFIFKSYEDAKKFAQSNNIKSSAEWIKLAKERKLPDDIPHSPDKLNEYKSYWKGWDEFLDNESIKK